MKRITLFTLGRFAVLAVLLHAGAAGAEELTIALLSEATVDDTVVTLDQIARITGGSAGLRKRLRSLT